MKTDSKCHPARRKIQTVIGVCVALEPHSVYCVMSLGHIPSQRTDFCWLIESVTMGRSQCQCLWSEFLFCLWPCELSLKPWLILDGSECFVTEAKNYAGGQKGFFFFLSFFKNAILLIKAGIFHRHLENYCVLI